MRFLEELFKFIGSASGIVSLCLLLWYRYKTEPKRKELSDLKENLAETTDPLLEQINRLYRDTNGYLIAYEFNKADLAKLFGENPAGYYISIQTESDEIRRKATALYRLLKKYDAYIFKGINYKEGKKFKLPKDTSFSEMGSQVAKIRRELIAKMTGTTEFDEKADFPDAAYLSELLSKLETFQVMLEDMKSSRFVR